MTDIQCAQPEALRLADCMHEMEKHHLQVAHDADMRPEDTLQWELSIQCSQTSAELRRLAALESSLQAPEGADLTDDEIIRATGASSKRKAEEHIRVARLAIALDRVLREQSSPSPAPVPEQEAVESAAKAVFQKLPGWCGQPWVDGGNSLKQDEARRYARAALSAAQAPAVDAGKAHPWKDGEGRTLFQIAAELSIPQRRTLKLAATREGGFVCPLPSGIHAAAAEALLAALRRKALITDDACPRITDAGRQAVAESKPPVQPLGGE